jgi:hypothetical protein
VRHYDAYLQAWLHVTPEISMATNKAELCLTFGKKTFVAVFGCRKKNWSLRHVQIRCGDRTATFARSELVKAMATLLGQEPMAPPPQAIKSHSGPRTDATLRERRTTVIRI